MALPRFFTEFDVPIGEVDKVFPTVVLLEAEIDLHERPPLRPLRFADQAHVRFARKPIALTCIARDAGANHILPGRSPAPVARHDVIQIELAAIEEFAAILTGVFIALEDVVPGKLYFFLRKPIEHKQHDHPRDPDFE